MVIGSGSIFAMLVKEGKLCFSEEIPMGTDRLAELFGEESVTMEHFAEELRSLDIPQRLAESTGFNSDDPVHFVTLGAAPRMLTGVTTESVFLSPEEALNKMICFRQKNIAETAALFNVSADDASAAMGGAAMVECFLKTFNARSFSCLPLTTREAVVELMVREEIKGEKEPFRDELRSICRAIGYKFGFDARHAETVSQTAEAILKELEKEFRFPPRSSMLLETAVLLHDIGRFVDTRDHNLHSAYLISATQLPGILTGERGFLNFKTEKRFVKCFGVS